MTSTLIAIMVPAKRKYLKPSWRSGSGRFPEAKVASSTLVGGIPVSGATLVGIGVASGNSWEESFLDT